MRYMWPASPPVYFYSKLVSSSSKPDGLGGVGVGAGVDSGGGGSASAPQGNGGQTSKPPKLPVAYRSKGE